MDASIVVLIGTILGTIVGALLAAIPSVLIQDRQLKEARRVEWRNYLLMLMEHLIDARQEYERFLGTSKDDEERHAGIIGKAISACIATTNPDLKRIAKDELTYCLVGAEDHPQSKDWPNRNRDAMHEAVSRLAELIKEA